MTIDRLEFHQKGNEISEMTRNLIEPKIRVNKWKAIKMNDILKVEIEQMKQRTANTSKLSKWTHKDQRYQFEENWKKRGKWNAIIDERR